jgi:hypothetical protein
LQEPHLEWSGAGAPKTFVFERHLREERPGDLDSAIAALERAVLELRGNGSAVRHVFSLYLPEDETCLSVLTAASGEEVEPLSRLVPAPMTRVAEARYFRGPVTKVTDDEAVTPDGDPDAAAAISPQTGG